MSEAMKNKLAMEIAFAGRSRHDVSEDAHEFWANSSGDARGVAFRQADAAIADLSPQWQGIDSAPRDGSRFLVSRIDRFDGDNETCIAHFSGVMWSGSPLWYDDEQNHMGEWHYWMPLPPPPTE